MRFETQLKILTEYSHHVKLYCGDGCCVTKWSSAQSSENFFFYANITKSCFLLIVINEFFWSCHNQHWGIQNTVSFYLLWKISKEEATNYQGCVYKQQKVIWTCERRGICALHAASVLCWPWTVEPENTQDTYAWKHHQYYILSVQILSGFHDGL